MDENERSFSEDKLDVGENVADAINSKLSFNNLEYIIPKLNEIPPKSERLTSRLWYCKKSPSSLYPYAIFVLVMFPKL